MRRYLFSALALAFGVAVAPRVASAQGGAVKRLAAVALFRGVGASPARPPRRPVTFIAQAQDYRWEGLIIGALSAGAFAAYLYEGFCHDRDSVTQGCKASNLMMITLAGATAGGVTGGLIGGLISKKRTGSKE